MNGDLIIKNADQIVTIAGLSPKRGMEMAELGIIKNGAMVIESGLIKFVGPCSLIPADFNTSDFEILDAKGKAVIPGFVDSHTHFIFSGFREEEFSMRLRGATYMEIMEKGGGILNTVGATRDSSLEELVALGTKRLDSMLSFGVTTVEGKSGYGLDFDTEVKILEAMALLDRDHPIDIVPTFLGAHSVPGEYNGRGDEYIEMISNKVLPHVVEKGLARFCDVFTEKNVFTVEQSRRLLTRAGKMGLKLTIHADEIESLGGAELAAELGAVSACHLLNASDAGIKAMAKAGVVATLLPGTAFSLKEPYANARHMIDTGCAVALATDFNPGSCFSESIPLVFALAVLQMGLSPEEALTAFTLNGAAALGLEKHTGSLEPGKQGDALILEFDSFKYIPYHIGVNCVEKVIKKGNVVFDKTE